MHKYLILVMGFIIAISPHVLRGAKALIETPKATKNIYEQQYQMGLFLKRYYQGKVVAANDIGAINYLADIRCLDLWGLADIEVGRAKYKKLYNKSMIEKIAYNRGVEIAIVYDNWFASSEIGGLPSSWKQAGQWKILENVICGGDIVSFYAVDTTKTQELIYNLQSFSNELPADVIQMVGVPVQPCPRAGGDR